MRGDGTYIDGVFKLAPRKFPVAHLKKRDFIPRGFFYDFVSEELNIGVPEMISFGWVDYNK